MQFPWWQFLFTVTSPPTCTCTMPACTQTAWYHALWYVPLLMQTWWWECNLQHDIIRLGKSALTCGCNSMIVPWRGPDWRAAAAVPWYNSSWWPNPLADDSSLRICMQNVLLYTSGLSPHPYRKADISCSDMPASTLLTSKPLLPEGAQACCVATRQLHFWRACSLLLPKSTFFSVYREIVITIFT